MGRDRGSPIPGPQAVLVAVLAVVETVVAVLAVVAVVTVLAVLVAVLVVLETVLVAVLVVLAVVVPVLLRDLAQARRHQVPCAAGEGRLGELLDSQRDELVLGVGVPDRGRPGAAVAAALENTAEVVERLGALALFVGEQRDGQRLARD